MWSGAQMRSEVARINMRGYQKAKRRWSGACFQKLLNWRLLSAWSTQWMARLGLQAIMETLASSIRQSSITSTPFCGSVDSQSEANTQSLLPTRSLLLPRMKLWQPMTVLLLPRTTLLYWTRQLLMVWRRVVTVSTCWQREKRMALRCRPFWQVMAGGAPLQSPPAMPWNWLFWQPCAKGGSGEFELEVEVAAGMMGANCYGLQLKLRQREFLRVVMAMLVCEIRVGSMFRPAKQSCPETTPSSRMSVTAVPARICSINRSYNSQLPLFAIYLKIIAFHVNYALSKYSVPIFFLRVLLH